MKPLQVFTGFGAVCLAVVALLTAAMFIHPPSEISVAIGGDAGQSVKATFLSERAPTLGFLRRGMALGAFLAVSYCLFAAVSPM